MDLPEIALKSVFSTSRPNEDMLYIITHTNDLSGRTCILFAKITMIAIIIF